MKKFAVVFSRNLVVTFFYTLFFGFGVSTASAESLPTNTKAQHAPSNMGKPSEGNLPRSSSFPQFFDFFCKDKNSLSLNGAGSIIMKSILEPRKAAGIRKGEDSLDIIAEDLAFVYHELPQKFNHDTMEWELEKGNPQRDGFVAFLTKLGIPYDIVTSSDEKTLKTQIRKKLQSFEIRSKESPHSVSLRFTNDMEVVVEGPKIPQYQDNPLLAGEWNNGEAQGQSIRVKNFVSQDEGVLCTHEPFKPESIIDCVAVKFLKDKLERDLSSGQITKDDFENKFMNLRVSLRACNMTQ